MGFQRRIRSPPAAWGLQVLAHQSGGQILTEGNDLEGEIAKCIADADSYYVLSFDSPPAAALGEFHSLQVKVEQAGTDSPYQHGVLRTTVKRRRQGSDRV